MSEPPFNRLRQHYPTAALRSELLTIHKDAYVVKVVVQVDAATLASALAADRMIEAAEDRACQRVFARLGIDNQVTPPPLPDSQLGDAHLPVKQPQTLKSTPSNPLSSSPSQPSADVSNGAGAASPFPEQASTAPKPSSPETTSDTASNTVASAEPVVKPKAAAAPEAAAEFKRAQDTPPSADPVDLSDIIVQTDVELERLGWDVNQGREFLERTYGKRSRHDLTDEELLEFLLYLESQPTPSP